MSSSSAVPTLALRLGFAQIENPTARLTLTNESGSWVAFSVAAPSTSAAACEGALPEWLDVVPASGHLAPQVGAACITDCLEGCMYFVVLLLLACVPCTPSVGGCCLDYARCSGVRSSCMQCNLMKTVVILHVADLASASASPWVRCST